VDYLLMLISPAVNNYTVGITLVIGKERCFGHSVNYFIFHKAGQLKFMKC